MRAIEADKGGRRILIERRRYTYLVHIPERRSVPERRSGFDRRRGIGRKRPPGRERRAVFILEKRSD
jgi:hypothetical protein